MINNWEIISRIDAATRRMHYTLVMDGTEHDARLLAKKLRGYVRAALPAQAPYVYAFELSEDLDEDTVEKIRTAAREGVEQTNKVNQLIPGGALGEPLFNADILKEDKDFPSFVTLDPSESFFQSVEEPASKQLSLTETKPLPGLEKTSIKTSMLSEEQMREATSPAADDNTSLSAQEAQPEEQVPPIDQNDMLIKDMEDSFLNKAPQVTDIFAARTRCDAFMDADSADAGVQAQQKRNQKIDDLADGKADLEHSFNIFEQKLKDQTNIIDLEELTAITDRLSVKDMEFVKHANTSPELAAEIAASAAEQEKTARLNNPATSGPSKQAFSPAEAALNASLPEIPIVGNRKPNQVSQEGNIMENNKKSELPEEVNLTDTLPPGKRPTIKLHADHAGSNLPKGENLEVEQETLEKTFNLTTTLNEDVMRSQYQKSFHNTQDPKPQHHNINSNAAKPPVLRLKKRSDTPAAPAAPKAPSAENTLFHLRRKQVPPPAAPSAPKAPAPAPKIPVAKPVIQQPAPAPKIPVAKPVIQKPVIQKPVPAPAKQVAPKAGLEKTTTIDHSIELPLSELKKHNWPLEVPLLPTYTLENMVMSVNRFAHATAVSVVDNPGKLYNPLVLHGPTGTGKTHFLNAMAYAFSKKIGQENIFMTNGVRLSRGIQRYVMEGNIEKFERFMDTVKILLIDDIHLLAINEQNRKYISTLLNKFLREQKQIVITSKYPPESLAKLEELIRFRLGSGWISELKPAGGSTHLKIVKKMLLENGVDLNDSQIASIFGGARMTLSTIMRNIHRLKVLENLVFPHMEEGKRSQALIFEKLLATNGEDPNSQILTLSPSDITSISTVGNGEWGRIGFFYPQNNSHMMNWMVYALQQRAKELNIPGGFEIAVRSSYATENIISSAFKIANLCDNKKLKGAVILGPSLDICEPSVRENFYDILTHMLEIMLIRCGIINAESAQAPSTYVKIISELLR